MTSISIRVDTYDLGTRSPDRICWRRRIHKSRMRRGNILRSFLCLIRSISCCYCCRCCCCWLILSAFFALCTVFLHSHTGRARAQTNIFHFVVDYEIAIYYSLLCILCMLLWSNAYTLFLFPHSLTHWSSNNFTTRSHVLHADVTRFFFSVQFVPFRSTTWSSAFYSELFFNFRFTLWPSTHTQLV